MTERTTMNSKTENTDDAKAGTAGSTAPINVNEPAKPSRLDQLQTLLTGNGGASIAEMTEATGWQAHSVRGAMAGALRKRGLAITSAKVDGVRRYHASMPA